MALYFATSRDFKFKSAQAKLKEFGIEIVQKDIDLIEIQSANEAEIATHKVQHAFAQVKEPVFVNDSSWIIPALNGFPGPYMKFINQWFTTEDFLRLCQPLQDRTVILRQVIAYTDGKEIKIFTNDAQGKILEEARGDDGIPSDSVISLSNEGYSIAEEKTKDNIPVTRKEANLMQEFAEWLKNKEGNIA